MSSKTNLEAQIAALQAQVAALQDTRKAASKKRTRNSNPDSDDDSTAALPNPGKNNKRPKKKPKTVKSAKPTLPTPPSQASNDDESDSKSESESDAEEEGPKVVRHPNYRLRNLKKPPKGMYRSMKSTPTSNNLDIFKTSPWGLTDDGVGYREFRNFARQCIVSILDTSQKWLQQEQDAIDDYFDTINAEYPVLAFQFDSFTAKAVARDYLQHRVDYKPHAKKSSSSRSKPSHKRTTTSKHTDTTSGEHFTEPSADQAQHVEDLTDDHNPCGLIKFVKEPMQSPGAGPSTSTKKRSLEFTDASSTPGSTASSSASEDNIDPALRAISKPAQTKPVDPPLSSSNIPNVQETPQVPVEKVKGKKTLNVAPTRSQPIRAKKSTADVPKQAAKQMKEAKKSKKKKALDD